MLHPGGSYTQNGHFFNSAKRYKAGKTKPELVRVYEKLHRGIWVFNGVFQLIDSWQGDSNSRKVFKFQLELTDDEME